MAIVRRPNDVGKGSYPEGESPQQKKSPGEVHGEGEHSLGQSGEYTDSPNPKAPRALIKTFSILARVGPSLAQDREFLAEVSGDEIDNKSPAGLDEAMSHPAFNVGPHEPLSPPNRRALLSFLRDRE